MRDDEEYITSGPFSAKELNQARKTIIKIVQGQYFEEEIRLLKDEKMIRSGPLRSKNVQLLNGVLRVCSRIQRAEFPFNERNPLVLPAISLSHDYENHISYQVIADAHKNNMHGGVSRTVVDIKQNYFIPAVRVGVKNYVKNCKKMCNHSS